tara:strand:- start:261 stop:689 length:429 start_codon:yes stop_codon:yes gene_type:complete
MTGQRKYEFFGYEWRLPLWDVDYITFWEGADIKFNQVLYKEVLIEQNWANFWKSFPLNPKRSFSLKISILRLLCKSIFLILGKERWHKFEFKFLDYYLTPLCGYAAWDYKKIVLDKRGFSTPLSWYTDEYLYKKGLNWDGQK